MLASLGFWRNFGDIEANLRKLNEVNGFLILYWVYK